MAISQITSKSITDSTITSDDIATGAVESSMTTQIGGRRNLIINGAMQVAQRGTSTTNAANGNYTVDRFKFRKANTDNLAMNIDQVADAPTGLVNSLKMTVGTAETTIDADEYVMLTTSIEAQDMQVSAYGTADAKDLTFSFYVKSSVTGTYCVSIWGADFSSSPDRRYYSATYTINAANTWEQKSVTISGNVNDAFANDNGEGFRIGFLVGAGTNYTSGSNNTWGDITNWAVGVSNSFLTTSNATFQITGVQLEVGTVATPFEHRSYGEELALCQRYAFVIYNPEDTMSGYNGTFATTTRLNACVFFPVPMRAPPTTFSVNATSNWGIVTPGYLNAACSTVTLSGASRFNAIVFATSTTNSFRVADPGNLYTTSSNANMIFEAEL